MMDEREIFLKLKSLLSSYVPPLVVMVDEDRRYDVYGNKRAKIGKKEHENVYFASTIIQKHHVGLYFFPIYTHRDRFSDQPDSLIKLLKGKSCFHLKKYDEAIFAEIEALLDKGIDVYREEGWV
ncbi:hypothetical protein V7O66_09050 [Methanolobus sp. ZRKC3]|uniref:hypothetical protein n=1 Tax=Methanolobus sp. ZRKC3 TaxID=3125786 RepID=UPI003246595D